MAGVTYHLRDRGTELVAAWQRHFAGVAPRGRLPRDGRRHGRDAAAGVRPADAGRVGRGGGGQPFRPSGVNDVLVQHYRLFRDE